MNPYEPMDGVMNTDLSGGGINSELKRLEPLQRQIMTFVHNSPSTNEGVHVQVIAQAVRAPTGSVLQAVEQLTTDGLLYTTIDDDHVAPIYSNRSYLGQEYHRRTVAVGDTKVFEVRMYIPQRMEKICESQLIWGMDKMSLISYLYFIIVNDTCTYFPE